MIPDTPSSTASGMGELADELRSTAEEMARTCSVPMELWQKHSTAVLRAADALEAQARDLAEARRPEVRCDGCGSSWTEADLARERAANPNLLSCCPERKPLTIDQWKARVDEALAALREKDMDLAGTWKAVLHVFGPEGCSKVGEAFPDGRKYVEDIRELTAPDPKKENGQ